MQNYHYEALDRKTGRRISGSLVAETEAAAIEQLRAKECSPISIAATPTSDGAKRSSLSESEAKPRAMGRLVGWIAAGRGRGVDRRTVMLFTRQFATLVNAGMPLARSLDVLRRQEANRRFQSVLRDLQDVIGAGGAFSSGLARHPRVFEALYVNMAKAGEAGGVLGPVLERLAHFMEKSERLKAKLKAAMIYPVVIMVVSAAIVSVLMIFVVPKFQQIFSGLLKGQPLPPLTQLLLVFSTFARDHVLVLLGGSFLVGASIKLAVATAAGLKALDWLRIRMPVVGNLTLKASVARFSRTFGSLLASGVPILDALDITRATAGNVHVAGALGRVHEEIRQGEPIARSIEKTGVFPIMVTGMIQVGEETGALPEMLGRIAGTFDDEVDTAVAGLTSIIEPIMIVLMAVVVGTIVIALFLPIVSVIQHLQ